MPGRYAGRHLLTNMFPLVVLALFPVVSGEFLSQCVRDGDTVEFVCPIISDIIFWSPEGLMDYDYFGDPATAHFTASFSTQETGQETHVQEITCRNGYGLFRHAVVIVTAATDPVLPIQPSLVRDITSSADKLTLTWDNPPSTFGDIHEVFFNYSIMVNVTGGYNTTLNYSLEVHEERANISIDLSGQECKQVEVAISLPGTCQERRVFGMLLKIPGMFLDNATSHPLFNADGYWTHLSISFTPPQLCPNQEANYTLSFDDREGEAWSRLPLELEDRGPVTVVLSSEDEPGLTRGKNYTLTVTVFTQYGNISSTSIFNTQSVRISQGGISGLTILGFNKSRVALSWQNPNYHLFSYVYVITSKPLQSGVITHYPMETFLKDAKPHVVIDLMGHECEVVEVTVTVYGNDDIRDAINVTLPSYDMNLSSPPFIDTSLYEDGSIREAEITFTPPRLCDFQRAYYTLSIVEVNGTNHIHYIGPVMIEDSQEPITIEIETGFTLNATYVVMVTVFTDYCNISQEQTFRFGYNQNDKPMESFPQGETESGTMSSSNGFQNDKPIEGLSQGETKSGILTSSRGLIVGGAVGGVLFLLMLAVTLGFVMGTLAVCYLRRIKRKKQRIMVQNPIYEGNQQIYEEIPDELYPAFISGRTSAPSSLASAIPPLRKVDLSPKMSVNERETLETARLSCSATDTEDCYTIMNPAGTCTVVTRLSRHSET